MYMRAFILFLLLILMTGTAVNAGTDDRGQPNDPNVNERANACYEGGVFAGKCGNTDLDRNGSVEAWEIDLFWTCGWYRIRFDFRLLSREVFPLPCGWALPSASTTQGFWARVRSCDLRGNRVVVAWANAAAVPVTVSTMSIIGFAQQKTSNSRTGQMTILGDGYNFYSIRVSDGRKTIDLGGC